MKTALSLSLVVGMLVTLAPAIGGQGGLAVDIACDGRTFRLNRMDPAATGPAARGDSFIVSGRIFPAGTIPAGFDDSFDLDSTQGSLGTWICRGTFLREGPHTALTTQFFYFDDGTILVAEGRVSHLRSGSIPTLHAVTGAAGEATGVAGQVVQSREEVIGTNITRFFNFRHMFTTSPRSPLASWSPSALKIGPVAPAQDTSRR